MNKHLKLFANHSAYLQAESNLDKPNVAVCQQEGDVHYNPYVDPYNGHAYVDLGLPSGTKWSTSTLYGYYGYGMTEPHYEGYPTYNGTENPLDISRDVANITLGGQWHIPTKTQFEELIANTTHTFNNGIMTFTGTNGNTLQLPAESDIYYDTFEQEYDGNTGYYGSSTPNGSNNYYILIFDESNIRVQSVPRGNGGAVTICPVVG